MGNHEQLAPASVVRNDIEAQFMWQINGERQLAELKTLSEEEYSEG